MAKKNKRTNNIIFLILCKTFERFPKVENPVKATKDFLLFLLENNKYIEFMIALTCAVRYKENISHLIIEMLLDGNRDVYNQIVKSVIEKRRKIAEKITKRRKRINVLTFGLYGIYKRRYDPIEPMRDFIEPLDDFWY